jgi:hypothetical protein
MSAGQLALRLASDQWDARGQPVAVVEIISAPGSDIQGSTISEPITAGEAAKLFTLDAGNYLVRLYLPNGGTDSEYVRLPPGEKKDLTFHLQDAPHDWLSQAMSVGMAQTLPRRKEAGELKAMLGETVGGPELALDALVERASISVERATTELGRLTENDKVSQARAWRWIQRVDPRRPWPAADRMTPLEIVRWWTGRPENEATELSVTHRDSHNALFVQLRSPRLVLAQRPRSFVAIRDPVRGSLYAVLPEGWPLSTSLRRRWAQASVLMTVVVESAMSPRDDLSVPVRWRCSPQVDDPEAMSLLGFLHSGRPRAGRALLKQAHRRLFRKTINPIAAAAGAYTLLSFMDETSEHFDPSWRNWIRNLYERFPAVPDGAIAMAQMALLYGEASASDEPNVERIRGYAFEAVRRGLPYLSFGIPILTEVLVMLEGDDRANDRTGEAVERTRLALQLMRRLGRIAQPGEFFTVLRLDEEFR